MGVIDVDWAWINVDCCSPYRLSRAAISPNSHSVPRILTWNTVNSCSSRTVRGLLRCVTLFPWGVTLASPYQSLAVEKGSAAPAADGPVGEAQHVHDLLG